MNRLIVCLVFFIFTFVGFSQTKSSWKEVGNSQKVRSDKQSSSLNIDSQRLFSLDMSEFKQSLELLQTNSDGFKKVTVVIPNAEGQMEEFSVEESSNFEPELQRQNPDIRAYSGRGITDSNATINFSVSESSIQTMILRGNNGSEFIDPLTDNKLIYKVSTSKSRKKGSLPLNCKTVDVSITKDLTKKANAVKANNNIFRTFRLALSCTGEYAAYFGGTKQQALAGMNATMTRVNGIFGKDLAVKLLLINDVLSIIYTNANTDPYSDAAEGVGDEINDGKWSSELQSTLTSVIGNANYDIGHLFGASGGGGDAGCIGCVCINPTASVPDGKGSGFTSPANDEPTGDSFDIDYVAHEMGHQLGANHTFSFEVEGTGVSIEPGSGSTIMGYAGITDYNVQNNSDDYFAYASIKQIQDNLINSCSVNTILTNQTPTVNAGLDYTIPSGTAFVLTGTASDPNGDAMTYCWEQNDSATNNTQGDNSIAYGTKSSGPLFRSFLPNTSTTRFFPTYNRVLSGQLSTTWESVATISRNLNFVFTARDNAGSNLAQTNSDAAVITVDGTKGPFAVTSQDSSNGSWISGSSQTITWSTNGSNSLAGAANVNIKLSTDGGLTFPIFLATSTPNDGSETITAPLTTAKNCRILIEPTANIFYAVNSSPFALGYSIETTCNSYNFSMPSPIPESQTYAEKTIVFPSTANAEVTDINVSITFTHEYISDVQIELVSPQGTTVKLFDQSCGDTDGTLILTYDDLGRDLNCDTKTSQVVIPAQALAAFNGEDPQGNWKLRYRDNWINDSGTIDAASIQICSSIYNALEVSSNEITNFILYPNPNNGSFTVLFESPDNLDIKVIVTDMLGKKIYDKTFKNTGSFNQIIELGNAASGTYIVTVIDGDRKGSSKIIIN